MRELLLEKLVEPITGSPLRLDVTRGGQGRIDEGTLTSEKTGTVYPIVRGIPRFVPKSVYADSFGLQWNTFREVQIDAEAGDSLSADRFRDETRWSREELEGKWVLDAGCGAARFAEVAAAMGPNLVALDMSSAVDAAAQTLARFANVDVVQASLLDPPFKAKSFDFAYCIGVLQHTPDPDRGVRQIVACVRPGGKFALTMYARRPWTKLNAKYVVRPLTKRLPAPVLLRAVELAMPAIFPITDRLFRIPYLGWAARFAIPVATYVPEQRPHWTTEQRLRESVLDTFDMLSPEFDSPMTWQEVERDLAEVGAKEWTFTTRVPVNVIGTR